MAFPTTPILDNFNRANENPLSDGGYWSGTFASFETQLQLVSNSITSTASSLSACSSIWRGFRAHNAECYFDIITAPGLNYGFSILMNVGASGSITGYDISFNNLVSPFWTIYRDFNGSQTALISNVSGSIVNGDSVGASVIGGVITLYVKHLGVWSVVTTVTDPSPLPAGDIGIDSTDIVTGGGQFYGNFGGGSLDPPPSGPVSPFFGYGFGL